MFDTALPEPEKLAGTETNMVAVSVTGWARVENAAAARRLATVAELVRRRTEVAVEHSQWACDDWDAAAAEVAAALDISHGKASSQMYLALALRERLPKVAAVFADGMLSVQVVTVIAWHTTLIQDGAALAAVDAEVAGDALRYGQLSAAKTAQAIDAIIDRHDPAALRRTRAYSRGREVVIDRNNTVDTGTTPLWGRLYAHDAELLDRRLMAMAHGVCEDDPRTVAQRRADALGALAAGAARLSCKCENPQCPVAQDDELPSRAIIHVVADEAGVAAATDVHNHGEDPPSRPVTPGMTVEEALAPDPEPDPPAARTKPALIMGGPPIPAALLAELIDGGATLTPIVFPGANSPAEPQYRPSPRLDTFIRCRDMTCRFPGCARPAEFCDIDHAVAYALGGPTHPSNLRCLCRKHHLVKTFHGWQDSQHPDGRIDWVSPNGQTHTTYPGSRLLFPSLCRPTGELTPLPARKPGSSRRTLMMPTRRRTRAQDRHRRITAERSLNTEYAAERIVERNKPPPF